MNDSWQADRDAFQRDLLPMLFAHGDKIGRQAARGNTKAQAVMRHYEMLYRSFDPMAHKLLAEAFKAWFEEQPKP